MYNKETKKKFGQHFLQDETVLWQISQVIGNLTAEHIVEIGPGSGQLTRQLITDCKSLTAVEIDEDCCHYLKSNPEFASLRLVQGDVLQLPLESLVSVGTKGVWVGNLPQRCHYHFIKLTKYRHLVKRVFHDTKGSC